MSRRTRLVWLSFFMGMTVVFGMLAFGETGLTGINLVATNVTMIDEADATDQPATQLPLDVPLDRDRWTGIVIHHLGEPAGDADYVHRLHLSYGYTGLGYHFLIGNGNGLADGAIQAGYRWLEQKPGAHVAGPAGDAHNQRSIAICLIGNGDRRPFTEAQMQSLIALVRRLQIDLSISAGNVHLHRDLAASTTSPGAYFTTARLQERLAR